MANGSQGEPKVQAGRIPATLNFALRHLALRLSTPEKTVLKEELVEEAILDLLKKHNHPLPESR